MRLVWIIALLIIVLCISLFYQASLRESLTGEEIAKAVTYDMRKKNEEGAIKSSSKLASFTVLLEEIYNNSQVSKEFSKKNNSILYNMGCVLEKQTEESIQE